MQYTSGPAKATIRNCSLTGGSLGYSNAREKSRIGNDHIISCNVIDDLTSSKSVSKPSDIRQLADNLAMAAAAIGSLKMTSVNTVTAKPNASVSPNIKLNTPLLIMTMVD